jgi:hypothetical protein
VVIRIFKGKGKSERKEIFGEDSVQNSPVKIL